MPADALFIGAAAAGKTLLLRRLQSICQELSSKGEYRLDPISNSTQATVGMEPVNLRCLKYSILLREVGSQLAGNWERYYDDCCCIVYVCDAASYSSLAADVVEFQHCWEAARKVHRSVALVFNKM